MNSIWHAVFPVSLLGSACRAADGPSSASAHVAANESFTKEISVLVIIPNPSGFFFMQSAGNAVMGKQAYFSQSMVRLRHLTCDMLEE